MVAYGCRQNLFGIVLLDHEPVEVILYVAGKVVKFQIELRLFRFGPLVRCPGLVWLCGENSKTHLVPVLPAEELLHVLAEFVRIRPGQRVMFEQIINPPSSKFTK